MKVPKERTGGAEVTPLDRLASSLVQVSTGVSLIPSCTDAEQFSLSDCPAISKRSMNGSIFTVGGEGTAERSVAHMHICNTIFTWMIMILMINTDGDSSVSYLTSSDEV